MEELVIGNPDCKIAEVIQVLKMAPDMRQLSKRLFYIELALGIAPAMLETLKNRIPDFNSLSSADKLGYFLEQWRFQEKGKAKLITFIRILEGEELHEFAQLLRDRFSFITNGGAAANGTGPLRDADVGIVNQNETIVKKQQHLVRIMPNLIRITHWNPTLFALLHAGGILSRDDFHTLDAAANSGERTRAFFDFIHDRLPGSPEAYDKVIEAFEALCQTGVSKELRGVYE